MPEVGRRGEGSGSEAGLVWPPAVERLPGSAGFLRDAGERQRFESVNGQVPVRRGQQPGVDAWIARAATAALAV